MCRAPFVIAFVSPTTPPPQGDPKGAQACAAIQPAGSSREGLLLRQDYYTPEVVMRISEKQLCVGLKPEFIAAECASCSKIGDRILQIRGKCVMVDRDLAELYKVPTKVLNQAVKRNVERFPERFRFALTPPEKEIVLIDPYSDAVTLEVLSKKRSGVKVRLVCKDRGKPTPTEIAKFNRQYKGLAVTYSDDFHDRFLIIDNVELHGLGSSINCLGRRVTSYTTRDAKEIAKLLAMMP